MEIADLITPDRIALDLKIRDKDHLLRELAALAEAAGATLPSSRILAALTAREALGSTGLGKGFALPHARMDGLSGCFGLFARLARPIDYAAIDGQRVDVLVLLLTPANDDASHMAALSLVARKIRAGDILGRLRRAEGARSVLGMLSEG
jgi:PTS system nitrogen regulatory IIA component